MSAAERQVNSAAIRTRKRRFSRILHGAVTRIAQIDVTSVRMKEQKRNRETNASMQYYLDVYA